MDLLKGKKKVFLYPQDMANQIVCVCVCAVFIVFGFVCFVGTVTSFYTVLHAPLAWPT